jgi:hypothetical protein
VSQGARLLLLLKQARSRPPLARRLVLTTQLLFTGVVPLLAMYIYEKHSKRLFLRRVRPGGLRAERWWAEWCSYAGLLFACFLACDLFSDFLHGTLGVVPWA